MAESARAHGLRRMLAQARAERVPLLGVVALAVLFVLLKLAGFTGWPIVGALVPPLVVAEISRRSNQSAQRTIAALLAVPLALGYAAVPLLLTALVVLFYAARALAPVLQTLVGVVLGAVVVLVWMLEKETITNVLEWTGRAANFVPAPVRWIARLAVALAVTAVGSVVVVVAIGAVFDGLGEFGGWAGQLEAAALFLWFVAAALRVFGLVNRVGRVVLALLIFAAAGWVLASWGFLPGIDGSGDIEESRWLVVFLVLLGLYATAEAGWNIWRKQKQGVDPPRESQAPAWCRMARRAGFVFAATSAFVLVAAFVAASYAARTPSLGVEDELGVIEPGTLPRPAVAMNDTELAYALLPVLQLADGELWRPTRAEDYVEALRREDLSGNVEDPDPAAESLPRQCDDVTQDACHMLACPPETPRCTEAPTPDGPATIYAHVIRFGREQDRRFFAGRNLHRLPDSSGESRQVNVVIQYWLFYAHNRWQAVTPVGYLVQEHAGDWESVTVGVSGAEPLFVAYSAHCGGRWYRWRDVEVRAGRFNGERWTQRRRVREVQGLHPVVAVALGSHANYLHSWYGRPPDWGSCKRVPEDATWALTFAGNVRDITGDEELLPVDVELVDTADAVMFFRGFWGPTDASSLQGFGDPNPLGRHPGRGPTSPALKDSWNRPLQTIFTGRAWKEGETG